MSVKLNDARRRKSWFETNFNGFVKLFTEDDPIKELIKTAVKVDSTSRFYIINYI